MLHKYWSKYASLGVDLIAFALLYLFLCQFVPAELLLAHSTVTGGDTASHYKTADYLQQVLLPEHKVIGWYPGNYGGYPLFTMYFPLLYLLAVAAAEFWPLQVTFKVITLAGPFMLPLCVYAMGLLMRLSFPAPLAMASGSLLFLMIDSNSMWGGNFYSTLAGEFSYAFSFALTFVFLGSVYRLSQDLTAGKAAQAWLVLLMILLLALIGLSHGFTLIICTLTSFWIIRQSRFLLRQVLCLLLVFGVAGFLMSGWLMQLLISAPYTTAFNILWVFSDWREVFPVVLWPALASFLLFSLLALLPATWPVPTLSSTAKKSLAFVWFMLLLTLLAFFSSETLHLPDIRFIPFAQLLIAVFGLALPAMLLSGSKAKLLLGATPLCLVLLWLGSHQTSVASWASWNLRGFEQAPGWPVYKELSNKLQGSFADPRVVYEHHPKNQQFGSIRAFESLPLFSGRATLEGLYFQSSLLSPSVFYLQSLYSEHASCPFPDYPCSRFAIERAKDYFDLMNVSQLIAVSPLLKQALRQHTEQYQLSHTIAGSEYEIWSIQHQNTGYVQALTTQPQYVEAAGFRDRFYQWFRSYNKNSSILYTAPADATAIYDFARRPAPYPQQKHHSQSCTVEEQLGYEEIRFTTSCPGTAHLIKVSYHPGWQVEGAQGIYLASPAFMLLWPEQQQVVLRFDHAKPRAIGLSMAVAGLAILLFILIGACGLVPSPFRRWPAVVDHPALNKTLQRGLMLCVLVFILLVLYRTVEPGLQRSLLQAQQWYNQATDLNTPAEQRPLYLNKAQAGFQRLAQLYPTSPLSDRIGYHWAMTLYLQGNYQDAIRIFAQVQQTKDSYYLADASYHLGMAAFRLQQWQQARRNFVLVAEELKDPYWTPHALERLKEITEQTEQRQ